MYMRKTYIYVYIYILSRGQRHAPARLDLHWRRGCLQTQATRAARLWWQGFERLYRYVLKLHFQCQWIIPLFLKRQFGGYPIFRHVYIYI